MIKIDLIKNAILDTNLGTLFYDNKPKAYLNLAKEQILIVGVEKQVYYKQLIFHDLLRDDIVNRDEELIALNGDPNYLLIDVIIFYSDIYLAYINSIKDNVLKEKLNNSFHGKDRIVELKKLLIASNLIDEFYIFKDKYITVEAINWCISNNIEFER